MKRLLLIGFILCSVAVHSQNTDGHIKIGIAKAVQQDYKGAIEDFTKEIKLHPENFKAYCYRAYAKEGLLDYKGALLDYDKAITLQPQNAELYNERALAKYSSGDKKMPAWIGKKQWILVFKVPLTC